MRLNCNPSLLKIVFQLTLPVNFKMSLNLREARPQHFCRVLLFCFVPYFLNPVYNEDYIYGCQIAFQCVTAL